jgi:ketosteroid isomerase-like protein
LTDQLLQPNAVPHHGWSALASTFAAPFIYIVTGRDRVKKLATVFLAVVLGGFLVAPAQAGPRHQDQDQAHWRPGCTQRFDQLVRQRDVAFQARDLRRLMPTYRQDAVEVDPSGTYLPGKARIEAHLTALFSLDFESTFIEYKRIVDGCETALLVLESRFTGAAIGGEMHFLTTQTFTFERGEWRLLLAANTPLP